MHTGIGLRTHLSTHNVEQDLRRVIDFLAKSSKYIAQEIKKSNRGKMGTHNSSGEEQLALDVISDQILLERLQIEKSFGIKDFVSEERDKIITLNTKGGRYSVSADPLDGSSLVDVNLSIGTILGIHEGEILSGKPGKDSLVAAMYILYGPLTTLLYTAKQGIHEFVLDTAGNFQLTSENLQLNKKGKIYSTGGLRDKWLPNHKSLIEKLESDQYKLRYSGGFVPDMNQLLLKKGGIFSYPALTDAPNGKLRLLFELQPMALLFEQAGGAATNGLENILDIIPKKLDERSPIYIGSKKEVELAKKYIQN